VALGGRAPLARLLRTDLLSTNVAAGQLRISHLLGGVITDDVFSSIPPGREVVATGDFDGDGDSDILLRRTQLFPFPDGSGSGRPTTVLFLQDGAVASQAWGFSPLGGGVAGVADFDGDGTSDVLWRDEYGRLQLWYWGVSTNVEVRPFNSEDWMVGSDWHVEGVGDVDGDGYPDIVWRHDGGQVAVWLMVGSIHRSEVWPVGTGFGLDWKIQGVGDFDGDGRADLLWRKDDGRLAIWFDGSDSRVAYPTWRNQGNPTDPSWQIQGVSDFNGDGRADILWRRTTDGLGSIWMMNGGTNAGESPYLFLDSA
jgi:VCBS repeat protein